MSLPIVRLKKNEERRLRAGHLWVYSNEIENSTLKHLAAGEEVILEAHDKTRLGVAYVNQHSLITARLFSRNNDARLNIHFFIHHIKTALALRSHLFDKPYYRLIFAESDNIPGLIIDRYNETLVIQTNTAGMDSKKELIVSAIQQVLPDIQHILFRNDSSTRIYEGLDQCIQVGLGNPPKMVSIEENNTVFNVPIWEGQKTGWFYDHRLNRARLQGYVANKRILDIFSYLGGWGIQAAVFGAKEVLCVDSSQFAIDRIAENAKLNKVDHQLQTLCQDAFSALKLLKQQNEKFDIIVLDPPAFVKRQKDLKNGLLAYQRVNELALKLLASYGILISCSCSMHIDFESFTQCLRKASLHRQDNFQIIERGHQGPDHPVHLSIPETDYLKMVMIRKFK